MEDGYQEFEYPESHKYAGHFYSGEIKDGLRDGQGEITFPNGDIFRGTFQDDDGVFGKFFFLSKEKGRDRFLGDIYEGEFQNGTFNGKGVYLYLSKNHVTPGDSYEGDFRDGKRHGPGIYYYADGSTSEGIWTEGWLTGFGKLTFPDGDYYEGDLDKGVPCGKGAYYWSNGESYVGHYFKGKRSGEGCYTYLDETITEGEFDCGMIDEKQIGQIEHKWSAHTIESLLEYSMKLKNANREGHLTRKSKYYKMKTVELLKGNEDAFLEFKGSLWTKYVPKTYQKLESSKKHRNELEDAVVKTVSAFLNSDGGTLLIGVKDKPRDEGDNPTDVIGIENDFDFLPSGKRNTEGYTHRLLEIFNNAFGGDKSITTLNIKISYLATDTGTVCRIDVKPVPQEKNCAVWVKTKTMGDEEFFFRSADTTVHASAKSAHNYISHHFEKYSE